MSNQQQAVLLGGPKRPSKQPTFGIFLSNKRRKPGLCKSFLEEHLIYSTKTDVTLDDGSVWPLYHEVKHETDCMYKALISFQCFEDGSYYAVARPLRTVNTLST